MPRFGQLEEQVMRRVWAADHPVQVREVREALLPDRTLAHTTVMTVLDKLFRKGWLRRETNGRAYRYSPVMSRESYTAALMHEAWSAAENPAAALVYFIEAMNADQIDALRDALRVVLPAPNGSRDSDTTVNETTVNDPTFRDPILHDPTVSGPADHGATRP